MRPFLENLISGAYVRYVLIERFCYYTGYTQQAVRKKIATNKWQQNREYRRAPDGHILIDLEGVSRWVERGASQ